MKELDARQKISLNRMINASALAEITLTSDDMDYYNANYGEEHRDRARMDDISKKLRALMIMDTENTNVLKEVYTEDYEAAVIEMRETTRLSEVSGFKKLFNFKAKKRAKNKLDVIRNKKQILKERADFDTIYARRVNGAMQRFDFNAIDKDNGAAGEDIQLNTLERLGFKVDGDIDYDEALEFIDKDKSKLPEYRKLMEYDDSNAKYFYHSRVFKEKHGDDIETSWVKRDIVGYCCNMENVDQDMNTFVHHAKNLDMINKKPQEVGAEVVNEEMEFLKDQVDSMVEWKNKHQELFTAELPKGSDVIWFATDINRAFNKLQISKTATKAIMNSDAYKNMDEKVKNDFEKDSVAYIWAMHSYLTALTAIAKRQYERLHNMQPIDAHFLTWDQSLEAALNDDFKS